uniref:Dual oxidase maturation factor 1 n=1 Tax=Photinus pyralis TaxID=7054 RepID=A0A1Y1LRP2_PHOPY
MAMGWFDYGRIEGLPSQYPPHKTPVTVDVLEAGFICAFLILAISCYVSLATPRLKHYGYLAIRVTLSLLIGLFIMLANFGQEWEVSHIRTKTPYRVGTGHEIDAEIGVKIGLRSVNVTLKSEPDGPLAHEIINYNERFEWTWDQGNFGFGPFAGLLQRQFRAAQYRGVPLPILWIIDYFVIDGEGYRFGRFYRTAGWYTHILIWTAFPCWLLAVILFRSVIRYGGYFLFLTGCLLILANITWSVVRNPADLVIPFEDAEIVMKYGFSYWLCLFTGLLCVALSITIIVIEAKWDTAISIFFGIDPLTCLDEYILTQSELELLRKKDSATNDIQMNEMQPSTSKQHIDPNELQTVFLKRKTSIHFTGAIQRIRKASLRPREDQQPLYGNMETIKEESRRRMV